MNCFVPPPAMESRSSLRCALAQQGSISFITVSFLIVSKKSEAQATVQSPSLDGFLSGMNEGSYSVSSSMAPYHFMVSYTW